MTKDFQVQYISQYRIGWLLVSALILYYGLFPLMMDVLFGRVVEWSLINLYFSASLILIHVLFYTVFLPKTKVLPSVIPTKSISNINLLLIFILSCVIFYNFPWHEDRISLGASVAGIFRAIWLYVCCSSIYASEKTKMKVLFFTMILMVIDESRTYFFVGFFILAASSLAESSNYKKFLFAFFILLGILLAAIRMDKSISFQESIYFGLVGEAFNATIPVGQVDSIILDSKLDHMLNVLLQPAITPFKIIINKLGLINIFDSNILNDQVKIQLNEKLAPQGGWYAIVDFVPYGLLYGTLFMFLYFIIVWFVTDFLFRNRAFPIVPFLIFISIKSTPYVYFKFILYIWVIFFIIETYRSFLRRLRF